MYKYSSFSTCTPTLVIFLFSFFFNNSHPNGWYLTGVLICIFLMTSDVRGFPGGSEVKSSACNVRDLGLIPGSGRPPGEGTGNPLQYSCLENPRDGEASWATVHGVAKSQTRLSDFTSLSLITSDVEHLLVCLLSMCMSSLKKCLRVIPFFFLPCP